MSAPRFVATGGHGSYAVLLDGEQIGNVRKHVERYNLRPPVTVTTWMAWRADGERIKPEHSIRGYRTRAEAGAALVEERP